MYVCRCVFVSLSLVHMCLCVSVFMCICRYVCIFVCLLLICIYLCMVCVGVCVQECVWLWMIQFYGCVLVDVYVYLSDPYTQVSISVWERQKQRQTQYLLWEPVPYPYILLKRSNHKTQSYLNLAQLRPLLSGPMNCVTWRQRLWQPGDNWGAFPSYRGPLSARKSPVPQKARLSFGPGLQSFFPLLFLFPFLKNS